MSRTCHLLIVLLLVLPALWSCGRERGLDAASRQLLTGLDHAVAMRDMYMARKQEQMDALRRLYQYTSDPLIRYETGLNIADEYFSFSFDSTQAYLKSCQSLAAGPLKSQERYDLATVRLAHLYAKAGSYMEAYNMLYAQVDTARFSDALKAEYLLALYDFSLDLSGNSGMVERLNIPEAAVFRPRLYAMLPKDSRQWREILRDEMIEQGRLADADSVNRILLGNVREDEHAYAIYAYFQSVISERMGRVNDELAWLVRSAECDLLNAVKDYASLTMVAQRILDVDIDRSFRYLRIAQEDALFYNAKLRPWQISRFLIGVQDAYSTRQEKQRKSSAIASILLAVLTAALALLAWFYISRSRKLSRIQEQLEESNARFSEANERLGMLNRQISESDQVKEGYIVSFLGGLANQIQTVRENDNHLRNLLKRGRSDQLLKELSTSSRAELAREEFYQTFDSTFLAMYPMFVEQFNALLVPQARMEPPKGRLNTELRIFALIKLGVEDSKQIARMLDYSLSTIYNYKVSVKNNAAGDRERFEDQVKNIGK